MPNKSRNHRKISATILSDTMAQLGWSGPQLSKALGMSESWATTCIGSGEAPEWVVLAIEALLARQGRALPQSALLLVRVPPGARDGAEAALRAMKCEITPL